MTMNLDLLEKELRTSLYGAVSVTQRHGMVAVNLPMVARDGDILVAWLKPDLAGWRISDMGTTMMKLSYEMDFNKILSGSRGSLYQSLLAESGLSDDDGEIYLTSDSQGLMRNLFRFGQGIVRLYDIGMWTKHRTESSFYDDLKETLFTIVGEDKIKENFLANVPNSHDYPIDFRVETNSKRPLYLFGIANKDKARLTTITLQHLSANNDEFDSIAICANLSDLPRKDSSRLMFAANDIAPDMSDIFAISRKILHRVIS